MKLEVSRVGKYKLITICESLRMIEDLAELKATIEQYLQKGEKFIAVNFADATYLYSGAIAVLVVCYKMIREAQGDLTIVEPHKRIRELLEQMNIDSLITIYQSEEELRLKKE